MFQIGCHLSSSKGYLAMGKEAVKLNANTFQFFTRNPRGGKAKAIDEQDVAAFLTFAEGHGIHSILAHAPYTLNACSKDDAHQRICTGNHDGTICAEWSIRPINCIISIPAAM